MLRSAKQLKKLSRLSGCVNGSNCGSVTQLSTSSVLLSNSQLNEEWKKLATVQLKDKKPETLLWKTAEVKKFLERIIN